MARQIQGSQRDFSSGEIDVALKRSDEHPARKSGLRQMKNARILNSGAVQNRSGRRALYLGTNGAPRTERFTISSGNVYDIQFSSGAVQIINSAGAPVATFTQQGNGAALPWASAADINSIVYALVGMSLYITFGHAMRPQVITWNGVSTWTIADYSELVIGNQKRTPFYRISPQGITLQPSGQSGAITVAASQALFTPAWVGVRMRYVNRQVLITGYINPTNVNATVLESLPGGQSIVFGSDPTPYFSVGDVVRGSVSGSVGLIVNMDSGFKTINVQLLTTATSGPAAGGGLPAVPIAGTTNTDIYAFVTTDHVAGPGGALGISGASAILGPQAVAIWDEEVMNDLRGYPAFCFVDQFRLGFADFPSLPAGIAWSAINSPTDLFVGANPANAMFEIAPAKSQVLYVVPGPESSEFVFCADRIYYIPISATNPLKPGSVSFQLLSGDGAAQVQPRISQELILYANAGQNSVMAIVASGAYLRPFNTKNLSEFHGHLFSSIKAIAVPNADGTFNERYAYVLNGDGSLVVGKYNPESLLTNAQVVGWGPWSGNATISWVAAHRADVLFTVTYFNSLPVVEVLDDSAYLDGALAVNALPGAFAPPGGQGPLWWIAGNSVDLMDQATRSMGNYQIDVSGFIVPQNNGGEDLTRADLMAGQRWTMTVEPFAPDAPSGVDVHQRMLRRRISNFAAYVVNSTGFTLQKLFSRKETPTSPALGTPVAIKRVPAWNVDEDATQPPKLRETVESWRPAGHSFDPRVAVIKDSPGPLQVVEIGVEVSI